jgi:hypothetical protein
MPYFDAGSAVYPVEKLLEEPEVLASIAAQAGGECRCAIIGSPFVATVERMGARLEYTVGVGSIVCSPDCGSGEGKRQLVLAEAAWGQGRVFGSAPRCVVAGGDAVRELALFGVKTTPVDLHGFVESVLRRGKRGLAVLPHIADALEIERVGGICGRLHSRNPLHPAGAVGKTGVEACCSDAYTLVGRIARLAAPILALDNTVVISTITGLGECLILGYNPITSSSRYLRLAGILGILYTCGVESERL